MTYRFAYRFVVNHYFISPHLNRPTTYNDSCSPLHIMKEEITERWYEMYKYIREWGVVSAYYYRILGCVATL